MIVTVARYRAITGDSATADATVSAKLELAQEMLEDVLGRSLEHGTYTETLWPTRDGYLWPSVVPITDPGGYTLDGDGLIGTFGPTWPNQTGSIDVTYSGGWVEPNANPTAANRLPFCIESDLAFAAKTLLGAGTASDFPAGAKSVTLGDASVTFGDDAPRNAVDAVKWSKATLRYFAGTTRGIGRIGVTAMSAL